MLIENVVPLLFIKAKESCTSGLGLLVTVRWSPRVSRTYVHWEPQTCPAYYSDASHVSNSSPTQAHGFWNDIPIKLRKARGNQGAGSQKRHQDMFIIT